MPDVISSRRSGRTRQTARRESIPGPGTPMAGHEGSVPGHLAGHEGSVPRHLAGREGDVCAMIRVQIFGGGALSQSQTGRQEGMDV